MQTCRHCGITKPRSEFHASKSNKSGLCYSCKICANAAREARRLADPEGQKAYWSAHYLKNAETKKAKASEYYYANTEVCNARTLAHYYENKEEISAVKKLYAELHADEIREHERLKRLENVEERRARRREHYAENKHMYIANAAKRRAATLLATPSWVDDDVLKRIYHLSDKMSSGTGVNYVVDHIIPLKHKLVCGLHVPWNLQIITAEENTAKSNYFKPGPMSNLPIEESMQKAA